MMEAARRMRYPMVVDADADFDHDYLLPAAQKALNKLASENGLTAGPAQLVRIQKPGYDDDPRFPPSDRNLETYIFEADAYLE